MKDAFRRIAKILGVVLMVSIPATLVGGFFWLRGSLPELDGNRDLAIMEAPVELLRDADGIVTIRAETELDAYRALGYAHAQDRLWQMDFMRRTGAGRVSEVVGPNTFELDRYLRGLGLYRLAEASFTALSPGARALLEAYAEGVNAFLAAPGGPWPPEFYLMRYRPEPWRPADSLVWGRLMALQLSGNWRSEILRLRLSQHLTPAQIDFLWPAYPADAAVTLSGLAGPRHAENGAAGPDPILRQVQDEASRGSSRLALSLSKGAEAVAQAPARGERTQRRRSSPALSSARARPLDILPGAGAPRDASNAWAISGARTRSGKPILANDPHLLLDAPGFWYLVRIETPTLTLTGATVPGVPFHLLGHNGTIAWGFTTTHADVQDFFIERLSQDKPGHYDTPEGARPFDTREEVIAVRGGKPVTITVRETRHGPVVSELQPHLAEGLPEGQVLALAWPALRPDDRSAEAMYELNRARDWDGFLAAMEGFHSPVQNLFYADTAGSIGFLTAGRIPLRKAGDGRLPVPGWSGDHDWTGTIPFGELPRQRDPAGGLIVNSNNRVVDDSYPYLITPKWPSRYRAERIEALLESTSPATIESSLALQQDILSPVARQLLPLLLPAPAASPEAEQARDLLAAWDHRMERDRPEPLIFYAWMFALNRALLADELGDNFDTFQRARAPLLLDILTEGPAWCDDVATPEAESCENRVAAALEAALGELDGRFGGAMADWRWGAAHIAGFPHPALDSIPVVSTLFGFPVETGGGFYTVNRGTARFGGPAERRYSHLHGATLRAVYDLADLDNSRFMIATGQSGNPFSALYGSLTERWRDGDHLKLVGGGTERNHRLTLNPR